MNLEKYFFFSNNIIGRDQKFLTLFGKKIKKEKIVGLGYNLFF
tara:strand:+ start:59 stop:187 length:129 start_codon:yes stop_codon:yes gene_type:complete